jgi:hypothetical protein
MNFINHLKSLSNIKIIIISRELVSEEFFGEKFDEVSILALSKQCFELTTISFSSPNPPV